jgi:Gas vesicle synthesis protein GvpL/GvpF
VPTVAIEQTVAAGERYVWLYAVTDVELPADGLTGSDLTGVGGEAVRPVRVAELTAVVSDVARAEFGETALRRNLEDLDWLGKTAREHHAVIEAVAGQGPVVPMRLATVYDSDARLAGELTERAADLHRALTRVRSSHEWGVRGHVSEPTDSQPADERSMSPGAAYLQRRRTQLNARENARREATRSAQAVYDELSRLAAGARLYPPQSPELTGQSAAMVLNAAYLVADDRSGEFQDQLTELARRHPALQLTLTGPWPAYSFVGEANAEDAQ